MKKQMVKNGLKLALVAGGVFALVPAVYGQGIGIDTLERLTVGTPQQLERGEQVYEDQCASCHGDEGQGGAELGERLGAEGFVDVDVERSGLYSIYSVIAHGYEYAEGEEHPVFDNLFVQDRWAVAHYVHDLIDDPQPSPDNVVDRIHREAREGVCDPAIREEVAGFAEPEDEAQLQLGADVYELRCATCHGDEGRGDGPGAGTVPPARDFEDPAEEWTNGTSPLAVFNTIDQGIEGTAMTPFGHLPEEELWAVTHFTREEFIPEEEREEMTEEQIDEVCRSLSAPPRPDPIPIDRAMEFLVDAQQEQRYLQLHDYGDPIVDVDADPVRGGQLYDQSCASCHGDEGQAIDTLGPYGSFPPYLHIEPRQLVPASVGGTYKDVAERILAGPHAALPDRPSVAAFSEQDWMDVQAYITQFEGEGRDRIRLSDELEEDEEPGAAHELNGIQIIPALDDETLQELQDLIDDADDVEDARQRLEDTDQLNPEDIRLTNGDAEPETPGNGDLTDEEETPPADEAEDAPDEEPAEGEVSDQEEEPAEEDDPQTPPETEESEQN